MGAESARYSFRHPRTGEWAHNLAHSLQEESWRTYIQPGWDFLSQTPDPVLRIVEVGFGRGFNSAELLRRLSMELPDKQVELTAFEPFPELLEPWPEPPQELQQWLPWWGKSAGNYRDSSASWQATIHTAAAQQAELWPQQDTHLVILDLFSPGRHPEQWQDPLFANLSAHAVRGAQLTSYSCARWLREQLQEYGWQTTVLRVSGQRDTLHAVFLPEIPTGDARIPT